MEQLTIKYLLVLVFICSCRTFQGNEPLNVQANYTHFFDRGPTMKGKPDWRPVFALKKPIHIEYKPMQHLFIFDRGRSIDTLHKLDTLVAEIPTGVPANYGPFKYLGKFEDYNQPAEFSNLIYVNPAKKDILQIMRMAVDSKGTQRHLHGIIYSNDSTNSLINSRLFE